MAKIRNYDKYSSKIECHIYEGNKLVMHLIYYPGRNYGYPRYHFENFCLQLPELDYEICRFMKAVHKIISNPQLSMDDVEVAINWQF